MGNDIREHTCEYTHAICWGCLNNTWRDELASRDDKIQKLESALFIVYVLVFVLLYVSR